MFARKVHHDLAVRLQTVLFDRSYHADNRDGFLRIEPQVLSDGIAVWPESLRELFVDDDHPWQLRRVMLREKPSGAQRNLHGPKVVRTRHTQVDLQLLPRRRRVAFHVDASPSHRSGERQHGNLALRNHARQMRDAVFDLPV